MDELKGLVEGLSRIEEAVDNLLTSWGIDPEEGI